MNVSAINGGDYSGESPFGVGLLSSQIKSAEFFHLLLTELQNQDPFEPVEHSEMLSQLAQFSTLEQTENLGLWMQEMVIHQQLAEGWGLLGYEIEYIDPQTGELSTGLVTAVKTEGGNVYAEVGTTQVPLAYITRVSLPSESGDTEE